MTGRDQAHRLTPSERCPGGARRRLARDEGGGVLLKLAVLIVVVVLGVGAGRGLGLLYAICGLAIVVVVAVSLRIPRLARFDEDVPDAPPDDVVGLQAWQSRKEAADAG